MLTFRNQSRCNAGGWWKHLPPRSEVLITQYQNIIYICQILSQFHFQYSLKYRLNLTLKFNFHKRQCSNLCAPHIPSIKSRTMMKICHTTQFKARWNHFRVHFIFKFKYSCVIKVYFCKIPTSLETCKHNYNIRGMKFFSIHQTALQNREQIHTYQPAMQGLSFLPL